MENGENSCLTWIKPWFKRIISSLLSNHTKYINKYSQSCGSDALSTHNSLFWLWICVWSLMVELFLPFSVCFGMLLSLNPGADILLIFQQWMYSACMHDWKKHNRQDWQGLIKKKKSFPNNQWCYTVFQVEKWDGQIEDGNFPGKI